MTVRSPRPRCSDVLREAATIAAGYDTGVTLRQFFYRLVAAGLLSNTRVAYQTLSTVTAEALAPFWDDSAYSAALGREAADRQALGTRRR